MTANRVRLHSVSVKNYLGAGEPAAVVELGDAMGVLCGPNNSGKSTIVRALDALKTFSRGSWVTTTHGRIQTPWIAEERASPEIFHWGRDRCELSATFLAPHESLGLRDLVKALKMSAPDPVQITLEVALRAREKRLSGIWFEDDKVFNPDSEAMAFRPSAGGLFPVHPESMKILDLSRLLTERMWYIPSLRALGQGNPNDLAALAAGAGVVNWVRTARNLNVRDPAQRQASETLRRFEREFAEFANFETIELMVPEQGGEINASIDGHLRPLSNLGSGIGEALLILLWAKVAHSGATALDVLLIEEPELHLHPALQRSLLEQLSRYGVQIVATTHSPTVVNCFARSGYRVFRTEFEAKEKRVSVRQVSGLVELRDLIESIGASPADVILADKVLLVEGSGDVPVFKAWLRKAPSHAGQNVAILSLGGNDAASPNFDAEQWRSLHPKIGAIIDSERKSPGEEVQKGREEVRTKLEAVGIRCHHTERRSTESYFTPRALRFTAIAR